MGEKTKKSGELKDPIVIIGAWNARGLSGSIE
jgi:hypothetical protein